MNAVTKAPVAKCALTVVPMVNGRAGRRFNARSENQSIGGVTDSTGRFDVQVPSAGGWSLRASAHNYYTSAFEEHDTYSTGIVLTDASPVYDLTFRLTPASSIEGIILDEAGEPVRNAQVGLSFYPPASPDGTNRRPQGRGQQRTDDRGHYKFQGLLAGSYGVSVKAQPWYASSTGGGRNDAEATDTAAPDPLDVVYPMVWYPGVTEMSAATQIVLRGGDVSEADFRLLPISGYHLRLSLPIQAEEVKGSGLARNVIGGTYLTQIMPDGSEAGVPVSMRVDAHGNADFAGLAPGTYQVHMQGDASGGPPPATTLHIDSSSARTLDLSQGVVGTTVSVKVDADSDTDSLQIYFRAKDSERTIYAQRPQNMQGGFARRGRPSSSPAIAENEQTHPERSVTLEPGVYDVFVSGGNDLHLASVSATGATAVGRTVTVGSTPASLVIHLASGRVRLSGTVMLHGHPEISEMVLLVPATLDNPSGLNVVRRDQSNTDGSFEIADILPGQYILVAIDHGWEINWSDPARLRHFLAKGVPLDIKPSDDVKENIEAQLP